MEITAKAQRGDGVSAQRTGGKLLDIYYIRGIH
jgi:hypothetical protein